MQTLFGKVQGNYLTSGLNFINPLVKVEMFDIRTQNYTMSGVHDQGDQAGDDAIRVLTHDGLEVVIDLTVLYSVLPSSATKIYREIGVDYKNVVVRPITRTKIRDNAVYYGSYFHCTRINAMSFRTEFIKTLKKTSNNADSYLNNFWFVTSRCRLQLKQVLNRK